MSAFPRSMVILLTSILIFPLATPIIALLFMREVTVIQQIGWMIVIIIGSIIITLSERSPKASLWLHSPWRSKSKNKS